MLPRFSWKTKYGLYHLFTKREVSGRGRSEGISRVQFKMPLRCSDRVTHWIAEQEVQMRGLSCDISLGEISTEMRVKVIGPYEITLLQGWAGVEFELAERARA